MSNINFFRIMGKNSGAAIAPTPPCSAQWYEEISSNMSSYQLSFPNSESFARGGVYVDEGGTRLYISQGWNTTNDLSQEVIQFSMSTPHNMSTISFVNSGSTSFNSSDQGGSIYGLGLHFSDDGTKLYRTLSGKGALCRWDLSTAWDITSVNSTVAQRADFLPYLTYSSASINTVYSESSNASFTQDGLNLIMGHQQNSVGAQLPGPMYVKQYEMNTAWDLSSIVELSGSSVTYLSNTGSASSIYFYGTDIGYIDPVSNNTDDFFTKNLDVANVRPVYQYHLGNNLIGKKNIGANGEITYLKVVNKNYMYGIGGYARLKQNTIDWSDVCIPPTQTLGFVFTNGGSAGSTINPCGGGGQVKIDLATNPQSDTTISLFGGATDSVTFLANGGNSPCFTFTNPTGDINGVFETDEPITMLRLQDILLKSVELSGVPALEALYVNGVTNDLTSLDISSNTLLTIIYIGGNSINTTDTDNVFINLDNNGLSNGIIGNNSGNNRSSNSDTARSNLIAKGWTIYD